MKYIITEELNQAINMNNMSVKFNMNNNSELCTFTATYNAEEKPDVKERKNYHV